MTASTAVVPSGADELVFEVGDAHEEAEVGQAVSIETGSESGVFESRA